MDITHPQRCTLMSGFHRSGHDFAVRALLERVPPDIQATDSGPVLAQMEGSLLKLGNIFRVCASRNIPLPRLLNSESVLTAICDSSRDLILQTLENSDAIIATHPYTAFAVSEHAKQSGWPGRILEVHTNFTPYPVFPHARLDFACGPRIDRQDLRTTCTYFTGIPVRRAFTPTPAQTRDGLLIVGGADGFGALKEIRNGLRPLGKRMFLAVGRNYRLEEQLRSSRRPGEKIISNEFDLSQLMRSCEAVVTKASGVTVAEAIASRTPLVFPPPIIPWEAEAAARLSAAGAGHVCPSWSCEDVDDLGEWLASRNSLARSVTRAARLNGEESAAAIWSVLLGDPQVENLKAPHPSTEEISAALHEIDVTNGPDDPFQPILFDVIRDWESQWQY